MVHKASESTQSRGLQVVKKQIKLKGQERGYSLVELLVSLALISIFSTLAVPSLVRTYRNYQMDDAASQVASELKFTRYEAIRRNNVITCLDNTQNGILTMFTDTNNDGVAQASEKQILFPANAPATLTTSASVPTSGALAGVVKAGALTDVNPANGVTTFDGRGAKTTAGASVYWVGNAAYGWRAVTVLPSGSVQVWSNVTGAWQQLS
jgi:prepilin-type N-terminal cleavage/methylation domain-containing protein